MGNEGLHVANTTLEKVGWDIKILKALYSLRVNTSAFLNNNNKNNNYDDDDDDKDNDNDNSNNKEKETTKGNGGIFPSQT